MSIGASPRRKENGPLLVGAARFLDDVARPHTVHLGIVRSIHAHARLLKIETAAALALPGVVGAYRAEDLTELVSPIPLPFGRERRTRAFAQPVLARDVVRHVGEPVAAVVADDPYRLADALEAIAVEYEPLPAVADAEAAVHGAVRVYPEWPDNVGVVARGAVGDAERGFAESHAVVPARLHLGRLSGAPIETRGALAYVDGDEMPYRSGLSYKDGVPIVYDPGDFPAAFEHAQAPAPNLAVNTGTGVASVLTAKLAANSLTATSPVSAS